MFPNAKIILDRFHIVQNLLRALNKLRIDTMNKYGIKSFEYKRFKRYWKLLLKSRWKLDSGYFAKRIHFKKWQSEKSMVDEILELNDEFKASYHYTNELLYYLDTNDYDKFVHTLNQEIELPKLIKTVMETTNLHIDKIQNTMNYQYTNGPIVS